jgi:hypothetical protein
VLSCSRQALPRPDDAASSRTTTAAECEAHWLRRRASCSLWSSSTTTRPRCCRTAYPYQRTGLNDNSRRATTPSSRVAVPARDENCPRCHARLTYYFTPRCLIPTSPRPATTQCSQTQPNRKDDNRTRPAPGLCSARVPSMQCETVQTSPLQQVVNGETTAL